MEISAARYLSYLANGGQLIERKVEVAKEVDKKEEASEKEEAKKNTHNRKTEKQKP